MISPIRRRRTSLALAWFQVQSATTAGNQWFSALWQAIDELETTPYQYSLAVEAEDLGLEIRELLLGRRRVKYRILFQILGGTVHILRVWHSARDAIRKEDL